MLHLGARWFVCNFVDRLPERTLQIVLQIVLHDHFEGQSSAGKGDRGIPSFPRDNKLPSILSFCLTFHTRINVSKTRSTARDTAPEISRPMSRVFLKMLPRLLLWDSATVALVSLFTS